MPAPVPTSNRHPRLPVSIIVLDKHRRERVVEIIGADTSLPTEIHTRFARAYDDQAAIRLEIAVGPGKTRDEVLVVGKVDLIGLVPCPRGSPIALVLDHRGDVLLVRLTDVGSGRSAEMRIDLRG